MTKLERVLAAIRRQPVDRPPYAFWRHFPEVDRNPAALAQATLRFHERYGSDILKVTPAAGYAVADCGLKALGMDRGNPAIDGARVWFCSDEHTTFASEAKVRVGERVRLWPAHVDPTVAYHERIVLVEGDEVVGELPVDLRGW